MVWIKFQQKEDIAAWKIQGMVNMRKVKKFFMNYWK